MTFDGAAAAPLASRLLPTCASSVAEPGNTPVSPGEGGPRGGPGEGPALTLGARADLVRAIIADVCRSYHVTLAEVRSRRRTPSLIAARNVLCRRLRHEAGLSLPRIGHHLGIRHTSVLYHLRHQPQWRAWRPQKPRTEPRFRKTGRAERKLIGALAAAGVMPADIAAALARSDTTVALWARRFAERG